MDPVRQIENIDADLVAGGAMTGRVVQDNGVPVPGKSISLWYVFEYNGVPVNLTPLTERIVTDADGVYRVQGLRPGVYRVCAEGYYPLPPTPGGCYGGPLGISEPTMAQDVRVRVGAETSGIDIFVGRTLPERSLSAGCGAPVDDPFTPTPAASPCTAPAASDPLTATAGCG